MNKTRKAELRQILLQNRQEVVSDLDRKRRDMKERGESRGMYSFGRTDDSADDCSQFDTEDNIDIRLIEAKRNILKSIDQALTRLGMGQYGCCADCNGEISAVRLKALPFAVRCKDCEEIREDKENRERTSLLKDPFASLGKDLGF